MNGKVIALSAFERPEYLSQTLAALAACEGIEAYQVLVSVDVRKRGAKPHPGVMRLLEDWDASALRVEVQREWNGCNRNMLTVMSLGFCRSEYVIALEDDVVFAPDALRWFEWARQWESVAFAACALHLDPPGDLDASDLRPFMTPWGWATWGSTWAKIEAGWQRDEGPTVPSWDMVVDGMRGEQLCVIPQVCRSTNIGRENGVHQGPGAPWVFGDVRLAGEFHGPYRLAG